MSPAPHSSDPSSEPGTRRAVAIAVALVLGGMGLIVVAGFAALAVVSPQTVQGLLGEGPKGEGGSALLLLALQLVAFVGLGIAFSLVVLRRGSG